MNFKFKLSSSHLKPQLQVLFLKLRFFNCPFKDAVRKKQVDDLFRCLVIICLGGS